MSLQENTLLHHFDKEQIRTLPDTIFTGDVIVVERMSQINAAMEYLNRQTVVGVDTESRPSFVRGVQYPTALLQIATTERCYLFRLTHIGVPQPLARFFANPNICKVGLAFRDDLKGLRRRRDFEPANCIDLQKIACQYGILDMGLQKMFAICYGCRISKAQQLTNWENSKLTNEQARYASTDAWATLLIYQKLQTIEPLPEDEVARLKAEDLQRMQAHQQEILLLRLHEHDSTQTS